MADPLLSEFPLSLHRRLYPLGFPLDLFTNSELVLAAADESWGAFVQRFDAPPVNVRIGVTDSAREAASRAPVFRSYRNLLSITLTDNDFAVCDLRQGFAYSWVNSAVAEDRAFFRYFFLEAMGYVLLSAARLAAVHAACVEYGGRGILFCGDSGAGKSSLAYACARSGWKYVCDDAIYLVRGSNSLLATGNPFLLRLRDTASGLFPEFAGLPAAIRPNGKPTIEIPTRTLYGTQIRFQTLVGCVLFLNRYSEPSQPALLPFSKAEALRRWSEMICYGDEDYRREHRTALQNLLAADLYEFRYSELPSAVAYLESFLGSEEKR